MLGLTEREYRQYLAKQEFEKFTENTLTKDELTKELEIEKKTGIAIDNAEHEEGVYCIAAPIYDFRNNVVADISISTSKREIIEKERYRQELLSCSSEISKIFGKVWQKIKIKYKWR